MLTRIADNVLSEYSIGITICFSVEFFSCMSAFLISVSVFAMLCSAVCSVTPAGYVTGAAKHGRTQTAVMQKQSSRLSTFLYTVFRTITSVIGFAVRCFRFGFACIIYVIGFGFILAFDAFRFRLVKGFVKARTFF